MGIIYSILNYCIRKAIPSPESDPAQTAALLKTTQEIGRAFFEGVADGISTSNFDLSSVLNKSTQTVNQSLQTLVHGLDINAPAHELGDKLKNSFNQIVAPTTDASALIMANFAGTLSKETFMKVSPYATATLMLMLGVPYTARYLYHRSIHRLSDPVLAKEVRRYSWKESSKKALLTGIGSTFKAALVSGAMTGCALAAGAGTYIYKKYQENLHFTERLSKAKTATQFDKIYYDFKPLNLEEFSAQVKQIAAIVAISSFAGSFLIDLCKGIHHRLQKKGEPSPILNETLTKQISEIALSAKMNHAYQLPFQNLLLSGPPGTGKTMIGKMIAKESGFNYVLMSGAELGQYIKLGTHVTEVNRLFESITNSRTPTILFIDEIDSLCPNRMTGLEIERTELITAFLNHTGTENRNFMLIGATNTPELIDPAVISRMNRKLTIGLPEQAERKRILLQNIQKYFPKKSERAFFYTKLDEIAKRTSGLSGRNLSSLILAIASAKWSHNSSLNDKMIDNLVDEFVGENTPS